MRRRLPLLAGALTIAIGSCGPKISSFEVTPRSLCPGDEARVTWVASGTTTMRVRLGDPRLGAEPSEELRLEPDTLEISLLATKGSKQATRQLAVLQYPDTLGEEVVFAAQIVRDTLVAAGEKNETRFGDRFALLTVAPDPTRKLEVRHAGRTAVLDPGGALSPAWAGLPLSGQWELRSPLSPAEAGNPQSLPERLRVRVVVRCRGGA